MRTETYGYCPRCGSRLYPADAEYMKATGGCSGCVTWDWSPTRHYQRAWNEYQDRKNSPRFRRRRRAESVLPPGATGEMN